MTEGPGVTAAAARDPQDAAGAVAQDPASAPQAAAGPAEPTQGSSMTGRQPGHPGWAAQAITGARRARASADRAAADRAAADPEADRTQVPPEDEEIEPHVRVDARLIESAILALRKPSSRPRCRWKPPAWPRRG